jgi:hypothetical protein
MRKWVNEKSHKHIHQIRVHLCNLWLMLTSKETEYRRQPVRRSLGEVGKTEYRKQYAEDRGQKTEHRSQKPVLSPFGCAQGRLCRRNRKQNTADRRQSTEI